MLDWLSSPLSGKAEHHIADWVAWHGRGMVLGWGILIPLGILVARYWKVTPSQSWPSELDNTFWWRWHQRLQYSGMAVALAAALSVVGTTTGAPTPASVHGLVGWTVVVLGIAQIFSGWLRGTKGGPTGERSASGDWRGDHYEMTPRRLAFEYAHKFGGLLALFLSIPAIVAGLIVADAPRWMMIAIVGWWLCLALVAAWLQRRGRCLDTYQAIWGPDDIHPGNAREPIGIGVRRVAPGPG